MLVFSLYFSITIIIQLRSHMLYHIHLKYLSIISDNFAQMCHVAITIIDKSKIALSDNDKNLSIDNYCR